MVNVYVTKDSVGLVALILTSVNQTQLLFAVTIPLVITILVALHVFAGLVMKNMNPSLVARISMNVHVIWMIVVTTAIAQTFPVITTVRVKPVSNLSMTLTGLNAMTLMNAKSEIITVMPTLLVLILLVHTLVLVTWDSLEMVVTVSKLKTLVILDVVKTLTVKKNLLVKVDGHETNLHVNVMQDIKVMHSRAVLIPMNALLTPIHVTKMKNATITMAVSNANVLLDMNVIATVTVLTLTNAPPTILTFVTLPKDFALITTVVTHVHAKLVTLVTVLTVLISMNVIKELMFVQPMRNVPIP